MELKGKQVTYSLCFESDGGCMDGCKCMYSMSNSF
jgi:hypothetical protein